MLLVLVLLLLLLRMRDELDGAELVDAEAGYGSCVSVTVLAQLDDDDDATIDPLAAGPGAPLLAGEKLAVVWANEEDEMLLLLLLLLGWWADRHDVICE